MLAILTTLFLCLIAESVSANNASKSNMCNILFQAKHELFPSRLVAIGDIHGSYASLLASLHAARVTTSPSECEWTAQINPVVLIQVGDVVDRGAETLECWKCLNRYL